MAHRLASLAVLPFLLLVASCSGPEESVFDPSADTTAPSLVSFEVMTATDQQAYAIWSSDEPVKAVLDYGAAADELHRHSYSQSEEFAVAGVVKLVAAASDAEYAYLLRMRDRAGNEASMNLDGGTFQTGTVAEEDLFVLAMIDVGWGDALFMEAPDGTRTLVDAGHPEDAVEVRGFLQWWGVSYLDFASMSHVHNDHIGGFYGDSYQDIVGILADFPVGTFLDITDKTLTNGPYEDLLEAMAARPPEVGHRFKEWGASSISDPDLQWGAGVRVDLLSAGRKEFLIPDYAAQEEAGSVINNDSMVYRVQYGDFAAILMGDAEFASEQFLMNHYSQEFLDVDILKLGHHGSNDSNSERYIDFIRPTVGLITNAISENGGVEHAYVLGRLRNRGIDYYASDRVIPNRDRALSGVRGDVIVYTDGSGFTVVARDVRFE